MARLGRSASAKPHLFTHIPASAQVSLRLREAGMIKASPTSLIAQGTDWRIFNELKRELKG